MMISWIFNFVIKNLKKVIKKSAKKIIPSKKIKTSKLKKYINHKFSTKNHDGYHLKY